MNYLACTTLTGTLHPQNGLIGGQIQRRNGDRNNIRVKHWLFLPRLRTLGNHAIPGLRWTRTPHSKVTVDQVALSESLELAKPGFEAFLRPNPAILFQSYVGPNKANNCWVTNHGGVTCIDLAAAEPKGLDLS